MTWCYQSDAPTDVVDVEGRVVAWLKELVFGEGVVVSCRSALAFGKGVIVSCRSALAFGFVEQVEAQPNTLWGLWQLCWGVGDHLAHSP